jgi:hypothetical protein
MTEKQQIKIPSKDELQNILNIFNHKLDSIAITTDELRNVQKSLIEGLILNLNERDEKIKLLESKEEIKKS